MMGQALKRFIKHLAASAGYTIQRRPTSLAWGADGFADQKRLLIDNPVQTILDVGGNIGQSVQIYRDLFPLASIHSFEPVEHAFCELERAYKQCALVVPHRVAVSDHTGSTRLFVNKCSLTSSVLPMTNAGASYLPLEMTACDREAIVQTIRLDDFCRDRNIGRIDILKLDIQGGELLALTGAARMLAEQRIRLIYTEVSFAEMYDGQPSFAELSQRLLRDGYRLFGLYNLKHFDRVGLAEADAIFVNPATRDAA